MFMKITERNNFACKLSLKIYTMSVWIHSTLAVNAGDWSIL